MIKDCVQPPPPPVILDGKNEYEIEKILDWDAKENPEIIQISADKDIVFPIKNSNPNYEPLNKGVS